MWLSCKGWCQIRKSGRGDRPRHERPQRHAKARPQRRQPDDEREHHEPAERRPEVEEAEDAVEVVAEPEPRARDAARLFVVIDGARPDPAEPAPVADDQGEGDRREARNERDEQARANVRPPRPEKAGDGHDERHGAHFHRERGGEQRARGRAEDGRGPALERQQEQRRARAGRARATASRPRPSPRSRETAARSRAAPPRSAPPSARRRSAR